MIRQYGGQRRGGGVNPLGVGVIATGSIYYLQDRDFFHDRFGGRAVCRTPWIVEGFLNGSCAATRRNRDTGRWEDATLQRQMISWPSSRGFSTRCLRFTSVVT